MAVWASQKRAGERKILLQRVIRKEINSYMNEKT